MENLIPWIIGISSGVVCLLGWLWLSAERDLNKNRRESEDARSGKQRLADEISNLKESLLDKEARLNEAANQNQEVSHQQSRLQNDIAELRGKLDESQRMILELGEAKHTLVDLQASGAGNPDELLRLNERIVELGQELAADQAKLRELDRMRERLAEGERIRQALREENRRHQDEVAHWRQRIVESEEGAKRLALIQEQFGELLTMQAALAESQRRFQDALVAFTRLMDTPAKVVVQTVTFEQFGGGGDEPLPTSSSNPVGNMNVTPPVLNVTTPSRNVTKPEAPNSDEESSSIEPPKRGFGILHLLPRLAAPQSRIKVLRGGILVCVIGIVVVVILLSKLNKSVAVSRAIRPVPPRAVNSEAQQPVNSPAAAVGTSDKAVRSE